MIVLYTRNNRNRSNLIEVGSDGHIRRYFQAPEITAEMAVKFANHEIGHCTKSRQSSDDVKQSCCSQ